MPASLPPALGHPSGTRAVYVLLCSKRMLACAWGEGGLDSGRDLQTDRDTSFLFAVQIIVNRNFMSAGVSSYHYFNNCSVFRTPCPSLSQYGQKVESTCTHNFFRIKHATLVDTCSNQKNLLLQIILSLMVP